MWAVVVAVVGRIEIADAMVAGYVPLRANACIVVVKIDVVGSILEDGGM